MVASGKILTLENHTQNGEWTIVLPRRGRHRRNSQSPEVWNLFLRVLGSELKLQMVIYEALGCSILSVNEQGRRQAMKPTLFFMPHCEAELCNNLLQANWGVESLNRVALFGNSFETYEQHVSFKYYDQEVSFMD
ncbi:hypothetical protein CRYUN_Cryun09bG0133800 [Craigia yunnanensis]